MYVIDNFCNTSGDTMTGVLNMGGHEITNIDSNPMTDQSVVSKKYVEDNFLSSRGTMTDDLNMGGYEVIGLSGVPSFNNSAASKKYVDDEILAGLRGVSGGISQAQADARYVRKTKIALGEWMDTFSDMNFVAYNWSPHVRKSMISSDTNIEIKVASFIMDINISQLSKHKLDIGIAYVDSSATVKKHLVTIALSDKSFSSLSVGSFGTMYSYHIHEVYYIGNDADTKAAILWQVGAKFETMKSHVLLDTTAYVSFALNEAGQYR